MPVYLDAEQAGAVNAMRDAFDTWKKRVSGDLTINGDAQRKHIKGTKEYGESLIKAQKNGYPGQSYLTIDEEECQRLVRAYAGKGDPVIANNEWQHKERCSTDDIIGYIVKKDGTKVETKNFMIHYRGKLHIRPRNEDTW